jgi:hypothetical protein
MQKGANKNELRGIQTLACATRLHYKCRTRHSSRGGGVDGAGTAHYLRQLFYEA